MRWKKDRLLTNPIHPAEDSWVPWWRPETPWLPPPIPEAPRRTENPYRRPSRPPGGDSWGYLGYRRNRLLTVLLVVLIVLFLNPRPLGTPPRQPLVLRVDRPDLIDPRLEVGLVVGLEVFGQTVRLPEVVFEEADPITVPGDFQRVIPGAHALQEGDGDTVSARTAVTGKVFRVIVEVLEAADESREHRLGVHGWGGRRRGKGVQGRSVGRLGSTEMRGLENPVLGKTGCTGEIFFNSFLLN